MPEQYQNKRDAAIDALLALAGGAAGDMAATSATGKIALSAAVSDGNTITIGDGVHAASVFEFDSGAAASGTITIAAGNAADGDTAVLHGAIFEFDTAADPGDFGDGHIRVVVGADAQATAVALATEIKAALPVDQVLTTAAAGAAGAWVVTVAWAAVGAGGNGVITVAGANLAKTNMAGGLAKGQAITAGRIGVEIAPTVAGTLNNLRDAIDAAVAVLGVGVAARRTDEGIALVNNTPGLAGNVAIIAVGANIQVTGMAGGLDAVTLRSMSAGIQSALIGTGLPIPLALADPGNDGFSAALVSNPITRACGRIRILVSNSGCVISLDGGVTNSITVPANMADDLAVAIPAGSDVRVKRLTGGVAITGLVVEVR